MPAGKAKKFYGFRPACLAAAMVSFCLFEPGDAHALKLTLKRIVFEGPKRAEVLTIVNDSAEEQTYRLGWRTMKMTESEALVTVEGDAAAEIKGVDGLVRYAPRRVTIAPGETQQVRLMLRKPAELAEGEYRSHLLVQPEAESVKFTPADPQKSANQPAIQLKMLTGMSIPVFVRHGNLAATATISDTRAKRIGDEAQIDMTLNRQGNRGLYGDFLFHCLTGGGETLARRVRGIAVYQEIDKRTLSYTVPAATDCQSLRIDYIGSDEDGSDEDVIQATATVPLS